MSKTPKIDKLAQDYEHLPICANAKIWNLARELEKQNAQMLEALEKIAEIGRQKGDARPQDAVSCFLIAEEAIKAAKGA